MTTLEQIGLMCPVCEKYFYSQAVVSTNSFGGKRTDFHERAAGSQPLPYEIHMCTTCGYAGKECDFNLYADDVSPLLKKLVWDELRPILDECHSYEERITGSMKYGAAAKVAEWEEYKMRDIANLLLRAAWCCVDEEDTEAERYFRRKAAWAFEKALTSFDGVSAAERPVLTYLVGELWRRVGDIPKAHEWFNRVAGEITDPSVQQWTVGLAHQQRDCPREWFG